MPDFDPAFLDLAAYGLDRVEPWVWAAAVGALVGAFVLGRFSTASRRALRQRAEQLESELGEARSQLADARQRLTEQRQAVEKHFEQTSDLFGDLTRQYTALYSHLAEGARSFCTDRTPALGQGFGAALLANATAEAGNAGSDAEIGATDGEPPASAEGAEAVDAGRPARG